MGFGTAIAASYTGLSNGFDRNGAIQFGGAAFDALNSFQNARGAGKMSMQALANQMALQQAAANQAAQEQAYLNQMRERLLTQTTAFGDSIRTAQQNLGSRAIITEQGIMDEEARLTDLYNPLLREGIDKMISTQFARDINTGQDGMPTLQRHRAQDMIRMISDDVARAQEGVRQSAVGNLTNRANAINSGRDGVFAEIQNVGLGQFNAERGLIGGGGDYSAPINAGSGIYNTISGGASAAAQDAGANFDTLMKYASLPKGSVNDPALLHLAKQP